jgi:hypothetical protein
MKLRHYVRRLALAFALCTMLASWAPAGAEGALPALTPIDVREGRQTQPRTDGRTAVWSDEHGAYALRVDTMQVSTLTTSEILPGNVDVDGDFAVWAQVDQQCGCKQHIRAKNLWTGQELEIASPTSISDAPRIAGRHVVWASYEQSHGKLQVRDIVAMSEPVLLMEWDGVPYIGVSQIKIAGDRILWYFYSSSRSNPISQLWSYSIASGEKTLLDGQATLRFGEILDLLADKLLVRFNSRFRIYDFSTGSFLETEIRTQYYTSATTDGRYIFWTVSSSSEPRSNVYGYDTLTKRSFQVADSASEAEYNDHLHARNGFLVLSRGIPTSDIYGAWIAALLPTGPRQSPGSPTCDYFAETSHTLCADFRNFWQRSGGLPVFGYPLSEAADELNADSGQVYLAQYVERQRFELHPEHAGTPYHVQLGRLGSDILRLQGREWQTLPKASPGAPHYFAATGHAVAPEFWDYWRGHGLEFGDQGVSEREALALFGYPISEPALELNSSGDRVLTQWFERARFEFHPGTQAPYQVLLGRLGAELLAHQR